MPMSSNPLARRRRARWRERGITLVESLVAFAVVSLGTVSVMRLQRDLHIGTDLSGQRAEASQFGQGAVERQRAAAGVDALPPAASTAVVAGRNVQFTVDGTTRPLSESAPNAGAVSTTTVSWPDSAGTSRVVSIDTMVGWSSPALSAALSLRPIDAPTARTLNRSSAVPVGAVDLGRGQSAWKPSLANPVVWVFDNASGRIVSVCASTAAVPTLAVTAADLSACVVSHATLLSGSVRASLAVPPDPVHADDLPPPLAVVLTLSHPAQASPPVCSADAEHSVEAVFGTGAAAVLRRQAVPSTATPASIGADRWTDLGDRFAAYQCVVPDPPDGWSGRSTVVPVVSASAGWTVGTALTDRRICRYVPTAVAGLPAGSAAADPNLAHPAQYVGVTESLGQQNFLIIRGDQVCPGPSADSDVATLQQQP